MRRADVKAQSSSEATDEVEGEMKKRSPGSARPDCGAGCGRPISLHVTNAPRSHLVVRKWRRRRLNSLSFPGSTLVLHSPNFRLVASLNPCSRRPVADTRMIARSFSLRTSAARRAYSTHGPPDRPVQHMTGPMLLETLAQLPKLLERQKVRALLYTMTLY